MSPKERHATSSMLAQPRDGGRRSCVFGKGSRSWVAAGAAALLGFGFTLTCFWPGYMSEDSVWQLVQARSGDYDPWHPPLMSWLWRTVDRLLPGPAGMLIVHNLAFWSGLALIAGQTVKRGRIAFLGALAVGLLPPVVGLLSTVWKDVALGSSLLLAFALLLIAQERRSLAMLLLTLPLLFYASAVRYNGAAAVLPLTLWAGPLFVRAHVSDARRRRAAIMAGGLLFLVIVGLALTIGNYLAAGRTPRSFRVLFVGDIVAIALATNEPIPPAAPEPESVSATFTRWREIIARHPREYFSYRLQMAARLLGIGSPTVCYPFQERSVSLDPSTATATPSGLNRWVMGNLDAVRDGPLFRAWIYCVLTLALTVLARRRNSVRREASAVLGASGVLYVIPYFVIAPDCDFRYSWWTVLVALSLPFLAFGRSPRADTHGDAPSL